MGSGVRNHDGGILGLLTLTDEHTEAIEFDLIRLGLRLRDVGSVGFNWRDLLVIVKRLGRDTELYRALHPEDDTSWSISDYLLALIADQSALRLWQAGGGRGSKPKPVPRPGDEPTQKHYGTAEPVESIVEWLGAEFGGMVERTPAEQRALDIRQGLADGHSRAALAEHYGVSLSTVGRIARGEAWGHLTSPSQSPARTFGEASEE